jgi:ribosomal protein L4
MPGANKKPWQQKGLGKARHGSRLSPQWMKGGVAHGPRFLSDLITHHFYYIDICN